LLLLGASALTRSNGTTMSPSTSSSEAFAAPALEPHTTPKPRKLLVYVGTYTGTKSKGIYLLHMDLASGKLDSPVLVAETSSPSFLATDPSNRFLYACNEVGNFSGQKSGAVGAFSIDPQTGKLTLLNQQPSGGDGPCHVIV